MPSGYFYSVLACMCFAPATLLIRKIEERWTSPFVVFIVLWFIVTAVSIFSAPDYYYSPMAILFIVSMSLIFFLGGRIANTSSSDSVLLNSQPVNLKPEQNENSILLNKFLFRFSLIAITSGLISILFLLRDSSFTSSALLKMKIPQIAEQFTRQRYSGVRLSQMTMFFLMINYSGCIAGGWIAAISNKWEKRSMSLSVFIPIIIFTYIYTARSVLLYGIVLYFGIFLAAINSRKRLGQLFKNNFNAVLIILAFICIPIIFLITQASRSGIEKISITSLHRLTEYLKVWMAGNISAFSIWFDNYKSSPSMMGQFTFGGIFELLNLSKREVGIYTISYDVNGRMSFTNIYTVFRFFVDDFGFIGTVFLILLMGYLIKSLLINSKYGSLTSISIAGGIISLFLFSFISSIWAYNTVLFAWIIFVFMIFIFENKFLLLRGLNSTNAGSFSK